MNRWRHPFLKANIESESVAALLHRRLLYFMDILSAESENEVKLPSEEVQQTFGKTCSK